MEGVIAGGNDAASGVQNEFALGVLLQIGENFVEDGNFFGEVVCFALGIVRTVWPAHPSRDAVDAIEAARFEERGKARFDLVVAANGGASEGGEVFCPMGFTGTGHADESETERLIRMRPHRESEIVKDAAHAKKYKRNWKWRIQQRYRA